MEKRSFEETIENIGQFLGKPEFHKYSFGQNHKKIEEIFVFMTKDLKDLKEKKKDKIEENKEKDKNVMQCLSYLMNICSNVVLYNHLIDFLCSFSLLAKNWADNCSKNKDISTISTMIVRYSQLHFTSTELYSFLKGLIPEIRRILDYTPKTFEISKMYFESLKDEK